MGPFAALCTAQSFVRGARCSRQAARSSVCVCTLCSYARCTQLRHNSFAVAKAFPSRTKTNSNKSMHDTGKTQAKTADAEKTHIKLFVISIFVLRFNYAQRNARMALVVTVIGQRKSRIVDVRTEPRVLFGSSNKRSTQLTVYQRTQLAKCIRQQMVISHEIFQYSQMACLVFIALRFVFAVLILPALVTSLFNFVPYFSHSFLLFLFFFLPLFPFYSSSIFWLVSLLPLTRSQRPTFPIQN